MKFALLFIIGFLNQPVHFETTKCKYDSILEFKETEKITYKQVTKLSYYSQLSRIALRRDYGEIDLIFSSLFGLENRKFETVEDREKIQSYFTKKDYIIRIQFKLPEGKLEEGVYKVNTSEDEGMQCVVRLYHVDKTKQGLKIVSRKYKVKSGKLEIEKISGSSFCGKVALEIPEYYSLSSTFSTKAISR